VLTALTFHLVLPGFLNKWFNVRVHALNWVRNILFLSSCRVEYARRCALAVFVCSIYWQCFATSSGCYVKFTCVCIIVYADNILLMAPPVTALQQLLYACEAELDLLDMTINVKKSACMRIGP